MRGFSGRVARGSTFRKMACGPPKGLAWVGNLERYEIIGKRPSALDPAIVTTHLQALQGELALP